jgi:glycosyltransferase involved in cell wall biosynthesis
MKSLREFLGVVFFLIKSPLSTFFPKAHVEVRSGFDATGPSVLIISTSAYGGKIFQGFQEVQKIIDHFAKRKVVIMYNSSPRIRLPGGLGWLFREMHSVLITAKFVEEIDMVFAYQIISILPFVFSHLMNKRKLVYMGGSIYESFFQFRSSQFKPYTILLLWKIMAKVADLIAIPTSALIKLSKLESSKTYEAPTRLFDSNFFERYSIRKKLKTRGMIIGYVGRLSPEKNVMALIDAFQIVKRSIPGIKLLIIGDGPLREEIARRGWNQKAVTVTGWVKNVEEYLNEMRLLILPSKIEGLPNAILEAMASGTPVLATQVGGIPHIIKNTETGFLLKYAYPEYIAKRIIEILGDTNTLQQVSANARVWIEQHLDEKKVLKLWQRVFNESNIRH